MNKFKIGDKAVLTEQRANEAMICCNWTTKEANAIYTVLNTDEKNETIKINNEGANKRGLLFHSEDFRKVYEL